MGISIVIADDHSVVRRGLRALIESERDMTILAEASDGREAIDAVARCRPDVLVLDLMMPGLRGIDVLRELEARRSPTRVVVLSMHADQAHVADALRHRAFGYVVKDASALDLVRGIREAAAGRRFLSEPLPPAWLETAAERPPEAETLYETLTLREREVLLMAVEGRTSQEIADRLAISRRTAETHRANLMRKLGLRNQRELVRFAVRARLVEP